MSMANWQIVSPIRNNVLLELGKRRNGILEISGIIIAILPEIHYIIQLQIDGNCRRLYDSLVSKEPPENNSGLRKPCMTVIRIMPINACFR